MDKYKVLEFLQELTILTKNHGIVVRVDEFEKLTEQGCYEIDEDWNSISFVTFKEKERQMQREKELAEWIKNNPDAILF